MNGDERGIGLEAPGRTPLPPGTGSVTVGLRDALTFAA